MAKNLRLKLPSDDHLIVQDVNKASTSKFAEELSDYNVIVADAAREVAEKSVRTPPFCFHLKITSAVEMMINNCSIYDLSWGLHSAVLSSDYPIFYSQSSEATFNLYTLSPLTLSSSHG
jgi:hypothetical protein